MKQRKLVFGILLGVSLLFSGCSLGKGEDQITKLDSKYIQSEETAQQEEDTAQQEMLSEGKEQASGEEESPKGDVTPKAEKKAETEQKDSTDAQSKQKVFEKKEEQKTSQSSASKKNDSQSSSTKSEKSKSTKSQKSSDKENTQKDSKEPAATEKASDSQTCRITIDCLTILANMQKLSGGKKAFVPSDGWILRNAEVTLKKGDSVYDVLYRACQKYKIHIEASYTPAYNTYYVEGIHQLYEFDCGDLSGWTYRVNGVSPNYGCSKYQVKAGDVVHWSYSCDAGRDIGDD